ncbi:MAG: segregation/condensation protein A [Planctomycetes bacterium]|jgi:segregation and condensation protein A|nr:segregation/condensation protein A [Planctomycetota bacterium]MBT4029369.1 segregation/condensation protein A [Planctomycetota bacterium]MBT4559813.1 segregation/condensation protein A [Planctomycetota bacterium]MBT5101692.1 segregation/condensation protein A [Planctomycetota bacterium]MBT5119998.1 segregation/condensation protein A [Planctomycetota bacterium]
MIEPTEPDSLPPSRPIPGLLLGDAAQSESAAAEPHDSISSFSVRLDRVFQGPLDLLLQLVRDKELEIHLVSLTQVCDAYCQHIRSLASIDVDEAADYLVVAATLLAIKSRSLLPTDELEGDEDPFDPGEELVQQLLAYKSLRQAADALAERWDERKKLLPAGGRWLGKYIQDDDEEDEEWDIGEVSIWDLLKVFSRLESETGFMRPHHVRPSGRPLRAYVEELWEQLQEQEATSLSELLSKSEAQSRGDAAYYLVALLELAKQQAVDLKQDSAFDDVVIRRVAGRDVVLEEIDEGFDENPGDLEPEIGDLLEGEA